MTPINLTDFVREAFDGVIVDELDPFDYFASDQERDRDQAAAVHVIAKDLAARLGRRLYQAEMVRITIDVAFEWQQRAERERERAFDHQEGKLWRHVDMSTYSRHD